MSSFEIDPRHGRSLDDGGRSPSRASQTTSPPIATGSFLLSSYYQIGKVAVHPLDSGGALGEPAVHWLDTATGAHSIQTDPSNRFVFVPHIAGRGPNAIFQFRFDERSGELTPNDPASREPRGRGRAASLPLPSGQGPRLHLERAGRQRDRLGVRPGQRNPGPGADRSDAPRRLRRSQQRAHRSRSPRRGGSSTPRTEGHNSVASFAVDEATGRLTATGRVATEPVPRAFGLDPSGSFLFVAGLESGRLASYRVDGESGDAHAARDLRRRRDPDVGAGHDAALGGVTAERSRPSAITLPPGLSALRADHGERAHWHCPFRAC